jgi:hypothetical protein
MFPVRYELNSKYYVEEIKSLNMYMSRGEQETWSWMSRRPEARNDCAGERRQQLSDRSTDLSVFKGV